MVDTSNKEINVGEEDLEVEIVEEHSSEESAADKKSSSEDNQEERLSDDENDDLVEIDEEGLRDEIRAKRRDERRSRRERAREREESLRKELLLSSAIISQLTDRLGAIERRNSGSDLAQIDAQLKQLNDAYGFERSRLSHGASESQGDVVTDATEKMIQIQNRFKELVSIKQAFIANNQRPPPLDPRLVTYASEWQKTHPWYNPSGDDQDSDMVRSIDNRLAKEGWDPSTKEYWSELTKRVEKVVSHRANKNYNNTSDDVDSDDDEKPRTNVSKNSSKAIVTGSGSSSSQPKNSSKIVLSKMQVDAIKEAGLWDDPVKRRSAIKHIQDYNKEHGV